MSENAGFNASCIPMTSLICSSLKALKKEGKVLVLLPTVSLELLVEVQLQCFLTLHCIVLYLFSIPDIRQDGYRTLDGFEWINNLHYQIANFAIQNYFRNVSLSSKEVCKKEY
jgi:hypothetical protein